MGCAFGSLTYKYATYLQNGRKEADGLFCKLSWMLYAKPVIDGYISVGTLISTPAVNACGQTNTDVGFAPIPPLVNFQITSLEYNGNPVVVGLNFPTLIAAMDDIVAALTAETGIQWSYTQLSTWEFLLCTEYTQNGDTVDIAIDVYSEDLLGALRMAVVLSGGEAPATPEYQTEEMNCITEAQYDEMVETYCAFTKNVSCKDIAKPADTDDCESNSGDANIELRESGDLELREDGN